MGKTIYIESTAGISGDMFVAALLDLGADEKVLKAALESLPLEGYRTVISRKTKSGIDVCDFDVIMDGGYENHDHDMAYLYGHKNRIVGHGHDHIHEHEQDHDHIHEHEHEHDHHGHHHEHEHEYDGHHHEQGHHHDGHHHEYEHDHDHIHEHGHHHDHGHHHEHRGLREVAEIIRAGEMTEGARNLALRIFDILAEAEAKAHNATKETVHFHEVGAVDSIVDIVAAAVCFDNLGITRVILPGLTEGTGTVRCAHGILPIPVPAVAAILSKHPIPISFMELEGEFVTPTGAAIAAAVMTDTRLPGAFTIQKVGIGGGKREYARPSMLRIMEIGEETSKAADDAADCVLKLETDIDDTSPESLGYLMERLYGAGAREVHYVPIYMKKNRPAIELVVICDEEKEEALSNIIFSETTTIGIRRQRMERTVLSRKAEIVETEYGVIAVKTVTLPGLGTRSYPEYESVKKAAEKHQVALEDVRRAVIRKLV